MMAEKEAPDRVPIPEEAAGASLVEFCVQLDDCTPTVLSVLVCINRNVMKISSCTIYRFLMQSHFTTCKKLVSIHKIPECKFLIVCVMVGESLPALSTSITKFPA